MEITRKTTIIVPCYNEEKRLRTKEFRDFAAAEKNLGFIFVNDGSTDNTIGVLRALEKSIPSQAIVLDLEENQGKAEAVRQGVLMAMGTDASYIGYWDADLATPLGAIADLCRILDRYEGYKMVIGSRVKMLGYDVERQAVRHYLGRIFATFASLILRIPVYDTQCGAKVFRKADDVRTAFGRRFIVSWTFDVEVLARLMIIAREKGDARPEAGWIESPLLRWSDVKGSKVKPFDFVKGGLELFRIFSFLYIPSVRNRYKKDLIQAGSPPPSSISRP